MELDEIKRRISSDEMRLSEALATALPMFRGLAADDLLVWCASELQGYDNGLRYYQQHAHDLPGYRVVQGALKVVLPDGSFAEINHPLAQHGRYFLSAPIQWLEDFASVPGDGAIVDLPELTTFIGRQMGGTVICQTQKNQLLRIIMNSKQTFISALDHVMNIRSQRAGAIQQAWTDMQDFSAKPIDPAPQQEAPQQGDSYLPTPPPEAQPLAQNPAVSAMQSPQPNVAAPAWQAAPPKISPPNQLKPPGLAQKPGVPNQLGVSQPPSLLKQPEPPKSLVPGAHNEPVEQTDPDGSGHAPHPGRRQDGAMNVKRRSMMLMQQAYGTKDKVLALSSLEQAERDVVIEYLLRMRWIKQLKNSTEYSLTKDGLKEVEQSLDY